MWAAQFLGFEDPNRWMTSGGLGTMGYGLPASIGVQIAHPEALVINVAGEASWLMNMQEMGTAMQFRAPVKQFILNNERLGMVRQWQELLHGERYSSSWSESLPDFVKLAEAFGCKGIKCDDPKTLDDAIMEMLRFDVTNGTGRAAQPNDGHIVFGKTGTTNDYRDAWFVGASPHIAAGVYVGFDTPKTMGRGATGGNYAAPVFRAFMEEALKDTAVDEQFVVPVEVRDLMAREARLEARIRGATAHLVARERAEAAAERAEAAAQVADAGSGRAGRQDTATVSFDSGAAPANAPAQKTAEPSLDGVY